MHRIVCIYLLLFLVAAASAPPGAAAPRLFFSKNLEAPANYRLHTVQPGETVFRIMRARGWTNEHIEHALPRIKKANPHISDLNALRPGQRIFLPPPRKATVESSQNPSSAGLTQKAYTVQPGDTLLGILRQRTEQDMATLRRHYVPLFQKLNPDIANIDRLYPGQNITLPVPGTSSTPLAQGKNATSANANQAQRTQESAPTGAQAAFSGSRPRAPGDSATANASVPESGPQKRASDDKPASGAPTSHRQAEQEAFFALAQRAGYQPIRRGKRYFPTEKGWLTVDPEHTPLVQATGGKTLVLVPGEATEKYADAGLTPLAVPGNWDTRDALNALSQNSPERAHLWTRNRPLITHRKGLGLELRGQWIFVDKSRTPPRIYVLIQDTQITFTTRVLAGLLQARNILLCTWDNEARELSPIQPPPADDLFVPRIRMQDLRREYGSTTPLSAPRTHRQVVLPQSEAPTAITFQCRTLGNSPKPALVFAHGTGAYLPALLHATGRECRVLAP